MLKKFLKFFKVLNSNSHPGEIAHAISIGLLLGVLPKDNFCWYILTFFFIFIRINKGALAIATMLFSILAQYLDNLFDKIGYAILTYDKFEAFFSKLLDIPFVSFTKFNNTIVMGSLAFGLLAYIPVYLIVRLFMKFWRSTFAPAVRKSKLIFFLSKIKLVQKIGDAYDSIE